jgi:hypothetical protein
MGRGPKKHQKRLSAPSHWLLDKLSGTLDMRTATAPQPRQNSTADSTADMSQVPMPPRRPPVLTSSATRCRWSSSSATASSMRSTRARSTPSSCSASSRSTARSAPTPPFPHRRGGTIQARQGQASSARTWRHSLLGYARCANVSSRLYQPLT